MIKLHIKKRRIVHRLKKVKNRNGFSVLDTVIGMGLILILSAGGFLTFGNITANAKTAKVQAAAKDVYTAVMASLFDNDPQTSADEVILRYNESNDKIRVAIKQDDSIPLIPAMSTETQILEIGQDVCVTATMIEEERVFAEMGFCSTDGNEIKPPTETPEPTPEPTPPIELPEPTPPVETSEPTPPVVTPEPTPPAPIISHKMITTWDTSKAGCSIITLPISGNIQGQVKWGKDSDPVSLSTTDNTSPLFPTPYGEVEITVDGSFDKWGGLNWADAKCLVSVNEWGETGTTDLTLAFHNADNLKRVNELPPTAKFLTRAFHMVDSNFELGENFKTTNVTDMSLMFSTTLKFDRELNLDTSNVKDMTMMFFNAKSINQNITLTDTKNVTNMSGMFQGAEKFDKPLNFDTSNVMYMTQMFEDARVFNQNLSNWKVDKVTLANRANFSNRSLLIPANLPKWSK